MEEKSMTARISAFARAYHAEHNQITIFNDTVAKKLFTSQEWEEISQAMTQGIGFFNPDFQGTAEEGLRWVVDHMLSPTPLGRSAFAEKSLERAVAIGAKQYLILGAGYDTFAYRQPHWAKNLEIFELDHPFTGEEKQTRLRHGDIEIPRNVHFISVDFQQDHWENALLSCEQFSLNHISVCSLLGVAYYLSHENFEKLLSKLAGILPKGSTIIFDYPEKYFADENKGNRGKKQALLAEAANEKMLAAYTFTEMELLLGAHDFLVYEHLTPDEITASYFDVYNKETPCGCITALDNVNYCLCVKRDA